MATLDSVRTKIQGLITKANSKTGRSDTDMTAAVDALIAGFGQGGGGITPTGSISITANGTYDVTDKAKAEVNVPAPAQNMVVFPIALATALGAGANSNQVVLSGHDFVRAHYADTGFFALWIPLSATTAADSGVAGPIWVGNRPLFTTKSPYYGFGLRSTGATAGAVAVLNTAELNGSGYGVSLRANSSGNINIYVASNYTMPAGNYLLVLGLAE